MDDRGWWVPAHGRKGACGSFPGLDRFRQALPSPPFVLPGEQAAFKEFETHGAWQGQEGRQAHLAPGAGGNLWGFFHLRGSLRCLIPLAGSLHSEGGLPFHRIRNSGTGLLLGQALTGMGVTPLTADQTWAGQRPQQELRAVPGQALG